VRTYGTAAYRFLSDCRSMEDLGVCFSGNLYRVEVDYLVREEWAMTSEDILWRRTKQGLFASEADVQVLEQYLSQQRQEQQVTQTSDQPVPAGH